MSPAENLLSSPLDRSLSGIAGFALSLMLSLMPVQGESEFASRQTGNMCGNDLFTNGAVRRIRIELEPQCLQALRKESRRYVLATLYSEGTTYRDVGIHLKGATGSFRGIDDKPSLTLDFGRFTGGQKFHGLRKIHLNNSVEDPSFVNELIGSELFRSAGVPAPRVSHARVEMNGRPLGLYVLKEGFTEDFLGIYFKRVDGNLYDTDWGHDVGERMKRLSGRDPENKQRDLETLAAATREMDLGRRWQGLEDSLDLDRFFTFMALEVMICHRDGYCMARNNFRIYYDPETGKAVFLPHGMDQLFGKADLPWKPHMAGLVARSALETPEARQRYEAQFRAIFTNLFIVDRLTNSVNQIVAGLRPFLEKSEFKGIEREAATVRDRIVQREIKLRRQLSRPEPAPPDFKDGIARLSGWVKADEPAGGRMEKTNGRIPVLHIVAGPVTGATWRTTARLRRGRYRFEGLGRIASVRALPYGRNQGAGLSVAGRLEQPFNFTGDSPWKTLAIDFEVHSDEEEVEFVCQLRASAGEAWFDQSSLRLFQRR